MTTPEHPIPPTQPERPTPPKSRRGIVDDPAPNAPVGDQGLPRAPRAEPRWPGHPRWCTCNDCENGTVPLELQGSTPTEVSRQTTGGMTHIYWSDGTVTWEKAV